MYDALVIGGGPAGAQCELWLTKLGLNSALLEPNRLGGLQARSPYTNSWLSVVQATTTARSVAENLAANITEQGCTILKEKCVKIASQGSEFAVETQGSKLQARFVVLATGTEEIKGGLETHEKVRLGLVGAFDAAAADRRVAILGGGDAAVEVYHSIAEKRPAALQVFGRTLRARDAMWATIPETCKQTGPYRVAQDQIIPADGGAPFAFDLAIACYGWQPVLPAQLPALATDTRGHLRVDESMETSVPGLFAIGDVNHRPYPCVTTALSDGVYAAKEIEARLARGGG